MIGRLVRTFVIVNVVQINDNVSETSIPSSGKRLCKHIRKNFTCMHSHSNNNFQNNYYQCLVTKYYKNIYKIPDKTSLYNVNIKDAVQFYYTPPSWPTYYLSTTISKEGITCNSMLVSKMIIKNVYRSHVAACLYARS